MFLQFTIVRIFPKLILNYVTLQLYTLNDSIMPSIMSHNLNNKDSIQKTFRILYNKLEIAAFMQCIQV